MKVFTSDKIREIDAYTIEHEPIASIALMERAAQACSAWIYNHFDRSKQVKIFCGPGNNGGDGLAIARQLSEKGYIVNVYTVLGNSKVSEDFATNLNRTRDIQGLKLQALASKDDFPAIAADSLIVDCLFGSGLSRPLEGIVADLVLKINDSGATVVSIDIPSGLFAEDKRRNYSETIVKAADTLTFQFPKRSFFYSDNEVYTGKWHILPIGLHRDAIERINSDFYYVDAELAASLILKRARFSHKGTFGHGLLIAGSYGMMGAAVLASRACLKAGAGLVTAHIPKKGYSILQTAVPEALVSIDPSENIFTQVPEFSRFSAVGAGPGIGVSEQVQLALRSLLENCNLPLILDADALNIIAMHRDLFEILPKGTILTPHPGEFARLFGKFDSAYERNHAQIEISKKHSIYIVLKGANTSISCPDGTCWYNSTGNPGMATGGSGDVLTGIILSLLAQGYSPKYAAILGTFIHGLAGDLASAEEGEEGVIAGDIINRVGRAFKQVKNSCQQ